jgi:hypothetical protein
MAHKKIHHHSIPFLKEKAPKSLKYPEAYAKIIARLFQNSINLVRSQIGNGKVV